mgnify:FL=1
MEFIPAFVIIAIIYLILWIKKFDFRKIQAQQKNTIFFFLIALSASLPLMITKEQRGFYLVTSFPFYAFAFSCCIAPAISVWTSKINFHSPSLHKYRLISVLLIMGVFVLSSFQIGKTRRDHDAMYDIRILGEILPKNSVIRIHGEMIDDWTLQCNMMRFYQISLSTAGDTASYFISDNELSKPIPDNYRKMEVDLKKYSLHRLIK